MQKFLSMLPYLYFLRFPLLIALILLLFPYIALKTGASSLLGGIFDLAGSSYVKTAGRMFFVALVSLNVAWTILETFWLVVLYAPERFAVSRLTMRWTKRQHALAFALLAAPTLIDAFWESIARGRAALSALLVGAVAGIIVASLLLWAISVATDNQEGTREKTPGKTTPNWFAQRRDLSLGYMSPESEGPRLGLGHVRAALMLVISMGIYIGIGIGKDYRIGSQPIVPTLAYVLLLLTLLCWGLAGMAFFLDRYRVPVVLPVAILFGLASLFPQSDYYYFLLTGRQRADLSSSMVMKAGNPKRTSAIVVAASGGGIQAAAWTARVLTGLEHESRNLGTQSADFGKSIRFISAVSGGSVATMYFVNEYTAKGLPNDEELKSVFESAEESSLDDVAWGLLYPDIWRTVIPLFPLKHTDRGYSLERAFTSRGDGLSKPLSDWSKGVSEGWRPAVAFNATSADSGARFVFSTSKLGAGVSGRMDFSNVYPSYDISIGTAVRLSATFPYVSPAARADLPSRAPEPRFHIVDGGYYDNYGISTLVEWLDDALSSSESDIQRVLIVQIRDSLPDSATEAKNAIGSLYQTFAPLSTMVRVRSTGQLAHNDEDTKLIERVAFKPNVSIESAVFQYCGHKPPLSWHLTATQKANIDNAWNNELSANGPWRIVKNFLAGGEPLPPSATICPLTDKEEQAAN